MTDDLDHLRKALRATPLAADASASVRRADALAAAMKAFDTHQEGRTQETATQPRPMSDRPNGAGFLTGVRLMLSNFTSRGALAATASVAAIAVGFSFVLTQTPQQALRLPATVEKPAVADTGTAKPVEPVPAKTEKAETADATPPARVQPTVAVPRPEPKADVAGSLTAQVAESIAPPQNELAKAKANDAIAQNQAPSAPAPAPPALRRNRAQLGQSATDQGLTDQLAASEQGTATAGSTAPDTEADAAFAAAPAVMEPAPVFAPEPTTEAFPNAKANPVHITAEDPVSTFSIDVDTASYAVIRSSLMNGYLPPPDAVRIEEMVNYFPYSYPAPKPGEAPFATAVTVTQTPWNPNTRLVHIGIEGRMPDTDQRPPLNLVFLIDTSGSMEDPNKLPLLKQSFRLMLSQLHADDRIAIVTYAGSAGEVLPPTPASDQTKVLAALENLSAGGSTAGQEGLQQAYAVADGMKHDGTVTRILLATDGDFNVGISDPDQLKDFIAQERKSGTYLSVLGFGRGNLDDATMQALAQNGNGTAAYIDTLSEAQKVLVDQLSGALFPIADDVKIQMEFNPAVIAEYRLIGYETRALNREDFNNDKVDAGEIGAGTSVTALYEVTPVGSPALRSDPLRYQAAKTTEKAPAPMELGFLKLRYKDPGSTASKLIETPVGPEPTTPDDDTRFATAIAGFGQLLTGATYLGDWGWDDAIALANGAKGKDDFGYRAEAVQMMRLGQSLSK